MANSNEFPKPSLTSDVVLFRYNDNQLQTLLIQRKNEPFRDFWAYPGGFVELGETSIEAAYRELYEETGIEDAVLFPLFADTEINRDPRGWIVSDVFYGFLLPNVIGEAGDDAKAIRWFDVEKMPELAFDHSMLFTKAMEKLKELLIFKILGKELLSDRFNIQVLERIYKLVLEEKNVEKYIQRLIDYKVLMPYKEEYYFEYANYNKVMNEGFF